MVYKQGEKRSRLGEIEIDYYAKISRCLGYKEH
jgi:hypothetical protein